MRGFAICQNPSQTRASEIFSAVEKQPKFFLAKRIRFFH
jgi:hypothetical protein